MERAVCRLGGIDPEADMRGGGYARSVLAFPLVSVLFLSLIERTQHWLPLSAGMADVSPVTAWNTAASFTTNTNWQNYSGEPTMGYLTQMSGLTVQNFDLTRGTFRLLLPLAVIGAVIPAAEAGAGDADTGRSVIVS